MSNLGLHVWTIFRVGFCLVSSSVGLIGHLTFLIITCRSGDLTPMFRFHGLRQIVNLSLTGAVFSAAFLAITVLSFLVLRIPAISIAWTCTAIQCIAIAALTSQLFGHAITLVDRYVALAYPVRYPHVMTRQRIFLTVVLTWIYTMAVSSIPLVMDSHLMVDASLENVQGTTIAANTVFELGRTFFEDNVNEKSFNPDSVQRSLSVEKAEFLKSVDATTNSLSKWMLLCNHVESVQLFTLFRGNLLIFVVANLIAGIVLSSALAVSVVAELVNLRHHRMTLHQHRLQRPRLEERRQNDVIVSRATLLTYFSCLLFWAPFVTIVCLRFDQRTMKMLEAYQAFAEETLLLLGLSMPVITVIVNFKMLRKLKFKWVVCRGVFKKEHEEQESSSPESVRYVRKSNESVHASNIKKKYLDRLGSKTKVAIKVTAK